MAGCEYGAPGRHPSSSASAGCSRLCGIGAGRGAGFLDCCFCATLSLCSRLDPPLGDHLTSQGKNSPQDGDRRRAARTTGAARYESDRACKYGHVGLRYTCSTSCVECACSASQRAKKSADAGARYRALRATNRQKITDGRRAARSLPIPTRPEPARCEICGGPPGRNRAAMSLDHCHEAHAFRGWLCSQCNLGLGMLGDNLASLERAVAYLKVNT